MGKCQHCIIYVTVIELSDSSIAFLFTEEIKQLPPKAPKGACKNGFLTFSISIKALQKTLLFLSISSTWFCPAGMVWFCVFAAVNSWKLWTLWQYGTDWTELPAATLHFYKWFTRGAQHLDPFCRKQAIIKRSAFAPPDSANLDRRWDF